MMYATWRKFDNVIVSPAPRGRLLALHVHKRRRVREKYRRAVVVLSDPPPNKDNAWDMLENIRDHGGMTDRALRKFCRIMCKFSIDARMEKRQ